MYKLKEGITLRPFGETSLINNDNLTDTLAAWLLETGRASAEDFADTPEPVVAEPVVAEFGEEPKALPVKKK